MRLWYCKDSSGMPTPVFSLGGIYVVDYGKGHHAYGFRPKRAFDIGRYAVLCMWGR